MTGNEEDPNTEDNAAIETTTVNPAADLALTKSESQDPALLGGELTYTLAVTNIGPSTSTGVILTDTLPAGVTFVSSVSSQGECSGTTIIACSLGALRSSGTATVTITVTPNVTGELTNIASVTSDTFDPITADNTATIATTINPAVGLSLVKADSPDPVLLGGDLTYTLTVINNSPVTGTGVTLVDTLPENVSFVSSSITQGECSGADTVTCTIGSLGSGDRATLTIVVIPTAVGTFTNTASVTGNEADLSTADNTAVEVTTVGPAADLAVTKAASPDPVLVGSSLTYVLTATNKGPSYATAVTLTDTLSDDVRFVSGVPSQGNCSETEGTVTCELGNLAIGGSATVTIVVIPTAVGTITNIARVTSSASDPNTDDNNASVITTVSPAADLALTHSDSPDPLLLGSGLTYTLAVTNKGPEGTTDVTLTDILPRRMSFVSSSSSQGDCSGTSTVTCTIGALASGDSAIVTIVVIPSVVGTITNTANVTSSVADPKPGNNIATGTTTVSPGADLSLTKSGSPEPVPLGSHLTYTLTVTNKGPSYVTAINFTDTLPKEVTFVSSTPSQGECIEVEGDVTCDLGNLASGDNATVTIVAIPRVVGAITNTASVAGNETDPSTGDNSVSEVTTVDPAANLAIAKSGSPDPVLIAIDLTYILTVTNEGPSDATGVTLTDTIPSGVTFASSTASQGTCSGTDAVNCTIGNLASGDSATVTIIVTPTVVGTIINTASVVANEVDPSTGDNVAIATTTVRAPLPPPPSVPAADLSITKAASLTRCCWGAT